MAAYMQHGIGVLFHELFRMEQNRIGQNELWNFVYIRIDMEL